VTTSIVKTETVHSGWTKLMIVTLRDDQGNEFEREVEHHGRAASVLPYDPERRTVMLVRVVRTPVLLEGEAGEESGELWEAPAGMMEEDDPAATVRREAMEEAGLRLGELEPVVTAWSTPGVCTEKIALFLAPYREADRVSEGGGLARENEGLTVAEMPLDRFWAMAERGEITDLKTFALAQALRLRHPELF
jgi:nudix-type nucleoside diphosphatase (YffH/AdpP family)